MKKSVFGRWPTPSYSYTQYNGVIKKRRWTPVFLYMLVVSLPMTAAVFMASLQVHAVHQTKSTKSSTTTLATRPVTQPQIVSTVASNAQQDNKLQDIITQFAANHSDHTWAIQVQGLNGDERTASLNSSVSYNSASLYKLLLVYPLIQKTPISQWGQVSVDVNGSSSTLSNCVTAMLKVSDNDCGDAVAAYVGWGYATDQLRAIGLASTNLNNPNGPVTTAADVTYYLHGLYDGKWFDGATRSYVLNILSQQSLRAGIPTGCGRYCSVADKTGDLDFVRHDAGIVRYSGGTYILSVFSSGASYADIAQLAAQIQSYMRAN